MATAGNSNPGSRISPPLTDGQSSVWAGWLWKRTPWRQGTWAWAKPSALGWRMNGRVWKSSKSGHSLKHIVIEFYDQGALKKVYF